jgi:hypothetical protein
MKVHTLAGVETLVVMAARFSGSRGTGTHDINFVIPLVEEALQTFRLEFLLGDKPYLSENVLGWLWQRSIKAVIPVKMRWIRTRKRRTMKRLCSSLSGSTSVSATFTRNIASEPKSRHSSRR